MNNVIGFDVGTGNLVCAKLEGSDMEFRALRNMFFPVSIDDIASSEISEDKLDYIEVRDSDDELEMCAIIGEDAYKWCNIFDQETRRPMQKGVLSSKDMDAIDVVAAMIDKLVGGKVDDGYCIYSIPATSVDVEIPPVLYHEKVFGKIFQSLGYKSKPMNEGMSIIFSECAKENFTGIAISFGAGLTNVACAYKGIPALTFSVSRGGDWIDENVANSLGKVSSRITKIKESDDFNLLDPRKGKKKDRKTREAIAVFYENLISYVLNVFNQEFEKHSDGLDVDDEIPIIISGGTSMANGFVDFFKEVFEEYKEEFPYDILEIRHASDPLNAVAKGNLVYAMWEKTKDIKEEE
jgi:hypothetical protein